jgi:hypothetical protein
MSKHPLLPLSAGSAYSSSQARYIGIAGHRECGNEAAGRVGLSGLDGVAN